MIHPLVNTWMAAIEHLVLEWPTTSINKTWIKTSPKKFMVNGLAPIEIFDICKYQNVNLKMTQLEAQYIDKSSLERAIMDLNCPAPSSDVVEISLIGDTKKGTASNRKHCLKQITFSARDKASILEFRSSDFLKKFLTDIYFVQQKVLKPLWYEAEKYPIICQFDSIMLRSPFWFIYLDQLGNHFSEAVLRRRIEKMDPITQSWLRFYSKHKDSDINYKSLDRCRDRMEESTWWPVYSEYINRYKSI